MALRKKGKPRGRPMPQNLKPFPKGVSGNPGGLPKFVGISEAIRNLLALTPVELENYNPQTIAEKVALARVKQAMLKGGLKDADFIADRAEGKAVQTVKQSLTLDDAQMVLDITKQPEKIEKDITPDPQSLPASEAT